MSTNLIRLICGWLSCGFLVLFLTKAAAQPIRVLNFNGSNGFEHESKKHAIQMIERICSQNKWDLTTSNDPGIFTQEILSTFDLIVFNNNCGNEGRIFTAQQQAAFQAFVRRGAGFVAIHCAGAIWHETGEFQNWYENLVGASLTRHPPVQYANCIIENRTHPSTTHLPDRWRIKDEFHTLKANPRSEVNVLISVDESSYEGNEKMNGDHPLVWYHLYEGGRVFFSSLGHTKEIYSDPDFIKMIEGGMRWTLDLRHPLTNDNVISKGLIVDLNADTGIVTDENNRVEKWLNQASWSAVKAFTRKDEGRSNAGSGRPTLLKNVAGLNGHRSVYFKKQELVSVDEDAFDHLITGSGYTWFCVLRAGLQSGELQNVNSFFGNLKNGGNYEGFWAGLDDNNRLWTGSRNGKSFGRWDANNPYVAGSRKLDTGQYYLVMGRMGAGTDTVNVKLFVNNPTIPVASGLFPINTSANASKLAIGQERDAMEHPGRESFHGEISRFLLYERPLTETELNSIAQHLMKNYDIKNEK